MRAGSPAQAGAAAGKGGELEGAAVAFGAAAHAGQAAGPGGRAEAAAVVDDVKGDQPVLRCQGDEAELRACSSVISISRPCRLAGTWLGR